MSRPDLYDLATAKGGIALIPRDLCAPGGVTERGVSRLYVWTVLVHRLMHTDPVGVISWGQQRIADAIGIERSIVQLADTVLERAGLMERVGKRQRAVAYRMLPAHLDAILHAHEQGDDDDEVTTQVTTQGTTHLTTQQPTYVVTKGSEEKSNHVKRSGNGAAAARPAATHDMTDNQANQETTLRFLATLSALTGHRFDPSTKARGIAAKAIVSRYDAPGALDAIADLGHDISCAGPGLILQLLDALPPRIRDLWRDHLPAECPHPGTEHLDRMPNLCWDCRAEAGDPKALRRQEAMATA